MNIFTSLLFLHGHIASAELVAADEPQAAPATPSAPVADRASESAATTPAFKGVVGWA